MNVDVTENKIYIFDSALRDGAQAKGISYSLEDKLHMLKVLDEAGVDYIEAGNPASNPKERAFFEQASKVTLENAKLVAFGSTRYKNTDVKEDAGVAALMSANTPCVAIFGKSWDLHVTDVLGTTLDENIAMVRDTLRYFKDQGKEVIFDAEHFFDGYKANKEYALAVLKAACEGGADVLALCDTNGGTMVYEVEEAVNTVMDMVDGVMVGIHCHNDAELAVANTLAAVKCGARHVQGTFLGYGERCGNARLTSIIPNLQLKMGYSCVTDAQMKNLFDIARQASEISNMVFDEKLPYVGSDAFAHKGGMHIDGIRKAKGSFEHIEPTLVGNEREFLLSEVAGKSAMAIKLKDQFPQVAQDSGKVRELMSKIKEMENLGYSFEGAEGSFDLFVKKELDMYESTFRVVHYRISDEPKIGDSFKSCAIVKLEVKGEEIMTAAEGNGPVNALDLAIKKALVEFFPSLAEVTLTDYKVRVLNSRAATAATVRVIIESSDGDNHWTTLGVSSDVIEASLLALIDSIDYKLLNIDKEK
jgi:2-isopropylmalate synthase